MLGEAFSIKDKSIIVTGAAGNLGKRYVQYLSNEGAVVYALDKEISTLESELGNVPAGRVKLFEVDLIVEDQFAKIVDRIFSDSGRIDGLVNNAAINPAVGADEGMDLFAPYENYSIDLFRKEIDANITSMMITMKHVSPIMIKQKSGSIVNVASEVSVAAHDHRVYATEGKYKSPAYTASKAAVVGLSRQWAARLGQCNVRVNAISIGGVRFPKIPDDFAERFGNTNMMRRMARPDEYNATIQYLISEASSFMTGANLIIDGGKTAW